MQADVIAIILQLDTIHWVKQQELLSLIYFSISAPMG